MQINPPIAVQIGCHSRRLEISNLNLLRLFLSSPAVVTLLRSSCVRTLRNLISVVLVGRAYERFLCQRFLNEVKMRALHLQQPPSTTITLHTDTPTPAPSPTQYLIRVHAAAITADELTWTETLARPSPIPAHDVCGTVVSTPSSSSPSSLTTTTPTFNIGDEVIALTSFSRDGAAAEYVVADADELARKPQTLTDVEAAAVPLSFLTAWQALFTHARVHAAQSVLILGAAGGVGTVAVQLARWCSDTGTVAGTCSAKNAEFVRSLGAHVVVDYESGKVEGTFDVVLDCVGGKAREECWRNVKMGGTLVSVAAPFSSEEKTQSDGVVKCIFFIVKPSGAELAKAADLIEKGVLRPVVDRVFPLDDGADAFDVLGKRHSRGKIILKL